MSELLISSAVRPAHRRCLPPASADVCRDAPWCAAGPLSHHHLQRERCPPLWVLRPPRQQMVMGRKLRQVWGLSNVAPATVVRACLPDERASARD